jgi:Domain of unknown function (DUF1851)
MYESFGAAFQHDDKFRRSTDQQASGLFVNEQLRELLICYGGQSFNQGLYRIFSEDDVAGWTKVIVNAFPSFTGRIICFAVDWLGRVFAIDADRLETGHPGVVMFEPGTGEALEIPCNVESFHEAELIQYREEALASTFYEQWRAFGGNAPSSRQCIGYKKPLFLGGADTVSNLEVSDLDVYWTVATQLLQKTKGLPLGTSLNKVSIN